MDLAMPARRSALDIFAIGTQLGPSPWVEVTQELNNSFGHCTFDPDPFHTDPDWARANSAFGGTIAYGFYTISMLTHLMHGALGELRHDPASDPKVYGQYLNYGFNRLRLVAPVVVGARIRGRFTVASVDVDARGREIMTYDCIVEIDGSDRPALVAEWLTIWMPSP